MRWLASRAVAIVGSTVLCVAGCLTSQEAPADGGGVEDPPITISGGSGGSNSQGGDAGESNGGTGRGGGSGTSSGKGDTDCNDDGDCEFRPDGRSKCSVPTGECVDCLIASDCDSNEQCTDNECVPLAICTSSSDCPPGTVCNTSTDVCVECISTADCTESEMCVSNTCRERCTVDGHCAPLGLRCDTGSGYCVSCLSDDDCEDARNCQLGTCVRDVCVEGTSTCEAAGLAVCSANGSVQGQPTPCGSQQTCLEDADGARCEPWVCIPGYEGCSTTMGERVVRCSDDGLTEEEVQDCADTMQLCIGGACTDAVCEPSTRFCAGNTVQQCDTTGMSFYLYQTCPTNQFCNPNTVTCAARLCTPGQPTCNGTVYTTCNEDGFGYEAGGTDCSTTDEFCGPMGCTTSAVDLIPATPTLYSSALGGYIMLNAYSVTSSRNLALIEQYMNPTSAITLVWLVYESTTQTGTYTLISNTSTTSTTGTGYQSSGALSVPLVAGRYYAIGLLWTSTTFFGYQQTTPSQTTSFGALFSAVVTTTSTTTPPTTVSVATNSVFVPQRLTTVP